MARIYCVETREYSRGMRLLSSLAWALEKQTLDIEHTILFTALRLFCVAFTLRCVCTEWLKRNRSRLLVGRWTTASTDCWRHSEAIFYSATLFCERCWRHHRRQYGVRLVRSTTLIRDVQRGERVSRCASLFAWSCAAWRCAPPKVPIMKVYAGTQLAGRRHETRACCDDPYLQQHDRARPQMFVFLPTIPPQLCPPYQHYSCIAAHAPKRTKPKLFRILWIFTRMRHERTLARRCAHFAQRSWHHAPHEFTNSPVRFLIADERDCECVSNR